MELRNREIVESINILIQAQAYWSLIEVEDRLSEFTCEREQNLHFYHGDEGANCWDWEAKGGSMKNISGNCKCEG